VIWVGVALAGAAGAALRYAIERAIGPPRSARLPRAAWIINPTGSLALGVVIGLGLAQGADPTAVTIAGTGFLGAYTVVGPLTFDTLRLWLEGERVTALVNSIGAILACAAAAAVGLALTNAL
jgi:fluoride exporter